MSTEASSLEAAIRDEIGENARPQGPLGGTTPEQLDAFRDEETGRLPANVFQLARQKDGEQARGPGRPKGSRNKANKDLAKLITHKFGDPVEAMASLYATPLDQLCEMLFVADGTVERQNTLDELLEGLALRVRELSRGNRKVDNRDAIDRLADACEALESAARSRAAKPGDVPVKALNIQLAAAKAVAEYVHSKKPVEVNAKVENDLVLVMPGVGGSGSQFDALDDATRMAAEVVGRALAKGEIQSADLAGLTFDKDSGQLVDAEFEEIAEDEADG